MTTTEIIRDVIVNRFKVDYYRDQYAAEFMCIIFNRFNRDGLTAYYCPVDRAIKTEINGKRQAPTMAAPY